MQLEKCTTDAQTVCSKCTTDAQTVLVMFCFFKWCVKNDLANAFILISFMTNNKSVKILQNLI